MYPDAIKEEDLWEYYPLHLELKHNLSIDIISFLIQQYPAALKCKKNSITAWDAGFCFGTSVDFIELLIEEYPEDIRFMDEQRHFPLHMICDVKRLEAAIPLMIEKYPDALQHKIINGYYPLENACRHGLSDSIIQQMYEAYPDALFDRQSITARKVYGTQTLGDIQLVGRKF